MFPPAVPLYQLYICTQITELTEKIYSKNISLYDVYSFWLAAEAIIMLQLHNRKPTQRYFFFLIFVKSLKSSLGGSRFEYETTSKKFMHTIMKLFITPGSERSVRNGVWQEKKKGVTSKGLNLFLNQTKAHTQLRIL